MQMVEVVIGLSRRLGRTARFWGTGRGTPWEEESTDIGVAELVVGFIQPAEGAAIMVNSSIVLPVLLLASLGSVFAQKVDLQGVIRDRYTSEPIPQARVTLIGLELGQPRMRRDGSGFSGRPRG
jgi:hypothetical protein